MPTLLFTGPGGAGTTTAAAAAAVRAARAGRRVRLVTGQEPPPGVTDPAGVEVVQADPRAGLERLWSEWGAQLSAAVPDLALPPATSVVPPPGAEELALLAALGRAGGGADLVVLDAGPLEVATRLVALPGTLRWWLEQALPTRLRMLGAVRTAAVRAGTVRRGAVDVALAAVPVLEDLLGRLALTDPSATAVRLVAVPRPGAAAALRRATTALAVHGQRPVGVLARVLPEPPAGAGGWWAVRAEEQAAELAALGEVAPLGAVAEAARAPAGADALAALLPDLPDPAGAPAGSSAPERVDGGWRLMLPLPFAGRGDVTLTRFEDDLVVTAAGTRRSLRLDALLRRCVVTAGSLADAGTAGARLEVGFAADPQLWPADLLAAVGEDAGQDGGQDAGERGAP